LTTIPGVEKNVTNSIAIGDADALIALILENDPHNKRAEKISQWLISNSITLIFPVTVFPEAITSLKRAANQPEKAHLLNKRLLNGDFQVEYINADILRLASEIFDQANSKKNTLFDAIVAATAKKYETNLIFSFDNWYPKLGFKLAGE